MDFGTGGGKKRRPRPEMNVTPLVDVVLVLLIIFMVVTPLLAKQFWISLPDQNDEQEPPPDTEPPLVVSVGSDGTIRINTEEVQAADLSSRLSRVLAARRSRTIFFDAADDADFGRAVSALDLARGGGATTIAVATEALPGIE
jgi:biopolymer transport protein ExbD/biopolymer transport protein TolR